MWARLLSLGGGRRWARKELARAPLAGMLVLGFLASVSVMPDMSGGPGGFAHARSNAIATLPDFVELSKRLRPAVVNISSTQSGPSFHAMPNPFGEDDPFGEFWRRFFGDPLPRGRSRQRSMGSGFIVERDGYIVTNNHVVESGENIVARLSDGSEFKAKVVGRDPKTDIAVIKIDVDRDLPVVPLGDSGYLEVGEWVLAIGNPFGLEHTVTSGIVSAKGRRIGAGPYDNFIQTDASINPGNSGGPLINLEGKVVGVNTAIFSRTGGNIGIGFAIPINLVKELLPQLKEDGKVTRGWLGVVIQKVTPEIAESLGMKRARGALVANVSQGGPAERAGVQVGDVIIDFDGTPVRESNDLPLIVARTPVGKPVNVGVLRDGRQRTVAVEIGELKEDEVLASVRSEGDFGLTVQQLTPQLASRLGLDSAEGVVVTSVEPGSPADEAGIRRSDVIIEINRKPVRKLSDFRNALRQIEKGKGVLFLVRREETTLFLALRSPD